MRGHVVGGLSLLLAGCVANQGDSEDPADPSLGTLQQGIQCAVTWRDQYHNTGTSCGTTSHSSICGPTAASMMRDAMTCGQCNPTPGQVRAWYDKVNGTANCCPSGTSCPSGPGALPHDLYKTMAHDNGDGCPVYTIEDKCASNYTIDDMKRDLAPEQGYVAVVSGDMMKNKSHCCSCWYSAYSGGAFNHTFYVHQYDAAKDQFAVYDPDADCNSGHKQTSPNYWTAAEMEWKRTFELNPNFTEALANYAHFQMIRGLNDEGLALIDKAVKLDPYNFLVLNFRIVVLFFVRRFDEAIAQGETALKMQPGSPLASASLFPIYVLKGKDAEAIAAAKAYYRNYDPGVEAVLDRGYAEGGLRTALKRMAEYLAGLTKTTFVLPLDIAIPFCLAGEKGPALDWLERGYEGRDPNMPYLRLPEFDAVRSEPRFQALFRKMNLEGPAAPKK